MSYGTRKRASSRPASGGKPATSVRASGSISWHTASKYLPCVKRRGLGECLQPFSAQESSELLWPVTDTPLCAPTLNR